MKTVIKKIPGGKLVRLDVSCSDKVDSLKITGDFFLHPEDVLEKIEEKLTGVKLPVDTAQITEELTRLLQESHASLIGVGVQDIVAALVEATK